MALKFSMIRGSAESRDNTRWALKNRFPFDTRGSLYGVAEGPGAGEPPYLNEHIEHRYYIRFRADRAAGVVTYSVWGRYREPIAHFARGRWVVSSRGAYGSGADIFRRATGLRSMYNNIDIRTHEVI